MKFQRDSTTYEPHSVLFDVTLWRSLLLIGVALYYFRFSLHPDGMTLYPKAAACMLNGQPMGICSPGFTYPPLFGFAMIPFVFLPMWVRNVLWYAVLIGCYLGQFSTCGIARVLNR